LIDRHDHEFTAFVTDRSRALLRSAYALTGDQYAAEDLVQTALAKVYARWARLSDDPEHYVRKIIYHDFVSIWRRRRRRGEVVLAEPPERSAPDDLHGSELRLVLGEALDTLPPRQRAVIVLRYLEDYSLLQTAAVLGCSTGTVASQANRALAKLRELIPAIDAAHLAPTETSRRWEAS
jgi:RNA polymerase sigma-70 factor (sigma-E family)